MAASPSGDHGCPITGSAALDVHAAGVAHPMVRAVPGSAAGSDGRSCTGGDGEVLAEDRGGWLEGLDPLAGDLLVAKRFVPPGGVSVAFGYRTSGLLLPERCGSETPTGRCNVAKVMGATVASFRPFFGGGGSFRRCGSGLPGVVGRSGYSAPVPALVVFCALPGLACRAPVVARRMLAGGGGVWRVQGVGRSAGV